MAAAPFLFTYLVLAFALAYPALMAELLIGRHTHRNMAQALSALPQHAGLKRIGMLTGIGGLVTASLILSFYGIVAGWMLGFAVVVPLRRHRLYPVRRLAHHLQHASQPHADR